MRKESRRSRRTRKKSRWKRKNKRTRRNNRRWSSMRKTSRRWRRMKIREGVKAAEEGGQVGRERKARSGGEGKGVGGRRGGTDMMASFSVRELRYLWT